ncbi:MAG TPA: thrombospondin type 3 repeat-containing protein, partial [Candidatus Paceibacterota bacterium]|nr:thrombospondin type 3 repeat-containing protein [Candidatus Paceibacterota bacterium]
MALSSKTVRIGAALLVSALFVFAGFYFSSPFQLTIAGATSTDELLKEYAKKDTDGDNLPDWQESLYGTDPSNPHSVEAGLTDSEAVAAGKVALRFKSETPTAPEPLTDDDFEVPAPTPGSATDEFAKSFFETYVTTGKGGTGDNSALVASLVSEAKTRVAAQVSTSYQIASVHSVPGTSVSSYAAAIEA